MARATVACAHGWAEAALQSLPRAHSLLLLLCGLLEVSHRRRARLLAIALLEELLLVEAHFAQRVVIRPPVARVPPEFGLEPLPLALECLRVGAEGEDARVCRRRRRCKLLLLRLRILLRIMLLRLLLKLRQCSVDLLANL